MKKTNFNINIFIYKYLGLLTTIPKDKHTEFHKIRTKTQKKT